VILEHGQHFGGQLAGNAHAFEVFGVLRVMAMIMPRWRLKRRRFNRIQPQLAALPAYRL
jgi:hypothetical protein